MFRTLLLYLSRAAWARNVVMNWGLARRVARRFVPGESEDQAVAAIKKLNAASITATVDILGENTTNPQEADRAAEAYLSIIARISAERLAAWVSVKLTALGLDVDPARCHEHMGRILTAARQHDIRVTIDMEDHTYTEITLAVLRKLRAEGFNNVQGVIQSYLYRSDADITALAGEGVEVRLCKGAYKEPPSVAYPRKRDVDAAYVRQMNVLLDCARSGRGYPMLATHDEHLITAAKAYALAHEIPAERFEFQMLYGIRSDLQEQLIREGWRVRVYVPFGTRWYPYFMRRLAERPANVWFFASNLLRR